MNRGIAFALPLAIGLVMTAFSMVTQSRGDDKDDFKLLFNGKDLEGWEAGKPELWSARTA